MRLGKAACAECQTGVPESKLKEVPPRGSQKWVCEGCHKKLTTEQPPGATARAQSTISGEMLKKNEEAKNG